MHKYYDIIDREKENLRNKLADIDRRFRITMAIIYFFGALIIGCLIYVGDILSIFGF